MAAARPACCMVQLIGSGVVVPCVPLLARVWAASLPGAVPERPPCTRLTVAVCDGSGTACVLYSTAIGSGVVVPLCVPWLACVWPASLPGAVPERLPWTRLRGVAGIIVHQVMCQYAAFLDLLPVHPDVQTLRNCKNKILRLFGKCISRAL